MGLEAVRCISWHEQPLLPTYFCHFPYTLSESNSSVIRTNDSNFSSFCTMRAYIYDTQDPADQRAPHDLGIEKTLDDLEKIGVLYWRIENDPNAVDKIDEIARERNYKNRDTIVVSPDVMGPIYEEKVKSFFAEHLHEDEEIRYILDGSGYFDVRDEKDIWIRIYMEKGDLIILPPGIYHRFTTDERNYIKAMRLFKEDPLWTPLNRPVAEDNKYRADYVRAYKITASN